MTKTKWHMIEPWLSLAMALAWLTVLIWASIHIGQNLDRLERLTEDPGTVVCYAALAEDSQPIPMPCDYRHGGWYPVTPPVHVPPCDDDAPGKPITGTCWLADDGGVAVWPRPYAPAPIYILAGAK